MPLYNDPQIFDSDGEQDFYRFLAATLQTPFPAHVRHEADRLIPFFAGAEKALLPYAKNYQEKQAAQAAAIKESFMTVAQAGASMIFGMPLIVAESFPGVMPTCNSAINGNMPVQAHRINAFLPPSLRMTGMNGFEPAGGNRRDRRMFGTARFGFLSLQFRNAQASHYQSLGFPYIAVPDDFMKVRNAQIVLKETARMMAAVNHDWFHTLTYGVVRQSVMMDTEQSALASLVPHKKFTEAYSFSRLRQWRAIRDIEDWAMRFKKELLQTMLDDEGENGMLHRQTRDYIDAFNESGMAADTTMLKSPAIPAKEYAMRLLAFNLVRMVPLDHAFTRAALKECATEADAEAVQRGFNRIYRAEYCKVLFGEGRRGAASAADFTGSVMDMTAHAVGLIAADAEAARQALSTPEGMALYPDLAPPQMQVAS